MATNPLDDAIARWAEAAEQVEARAPAPPWNVRTDGGVPVKPAYTSRDWPGGDEVESERLGLPGQPPFTRGVFPTGHRNVAWQSQQIVGLGTAEETAARLRFVLEQGQRGHRGAVLNVVFDQPTHAGLDSDHRLARSLVGKGGVALDTLGDMATLIEPFDPSDTFISLVLMGTAPIALAMYREAAARRGVPAARLAGVMLNDPLTSCWGARTHILPPRPSVRLVTDVFEICGAEMPRWNTVGVSGYHVREAGASPVQELAFTLAAALAYVEAGVARGLDPNEFVARFSFFFEVHNDFFEEIAKLRAARRLWATELRRRFGVADPRALALRFHVQTAGSSCTAQEPENNVVRTAVQALAAVLAGTNGLHANAMDEALAIPTETSARIALRTQQILREEMGVTRVADPLGGSWFLESLTDELEARARDLLAEIEANGETLLDAVEAVVASGWIDRRVRDEAWKTQQLVEAGERPVVGVNRYAEPDAELRIELFAPDPALEQKQLRRLERWKAQRDAAATRVALDDLRRACDTEVNLVGPLQAAVAAGATLGRSPTACATPSARPRSRPRERRGPRRTGRARRHPGPAAGRRRVDQPQRPGGRRGVARAGAPPRRGDPPVPGPGADRGARRSSRPWPRWTRQGCRQGSSPRCASTRPSRTCGASTSWWPRSSRSTRGASSAPVA
ncbi:MAG: methylmalonyl-CoA mutase family protein [Acidimicrobiia bacterium]|nr:methylmalonyl-CoA mutase family protein [Acidimicrobiia bacterium]